MSQDQPAVSLREITAQTVDPDFARNSKIHRAWKIMAR